MAYYGQGEDAYDMNVRRMDSHGGWLANPSDLARFTMHVDGFTTTPNILRSDSIAVMTTPIAANQGFAHGWAVNSLGNWWHNGSLPGTTTIMVRTKSGLCWATLTNTPTPDSKIGLDLDKMMWKPKPAIVKGVGSADRTCRSESTRSAVDFSNAEGGGCFGGDPIRPSLRKLIYAIYLLPEMQGMGIGRALFAHVAGALAAQKLKHMRLWGLRENPSTGFYKRLGGQIVAEDVYQIGDETFPAVT